MLFSLWLAQCLYTIWLLPFWERLFLIRVVCVRVRPYQRLIVCMHRNIGWINYRIKLKKEWIFSFIAHALLTINTKSVFLISFRHHVAFVFLFSFMQLPNWWTLFAELGVLLIPLKKKSLMLRNNSDEWYNRWHHWWQDFKETTKTLVPTYNVIVLTNSDCKERQWNK